MNRLPLIDFSRNIIRQKKDIKVAVDMTCGNGNDALFLSEVADKVIAFDIQEIAIENTRKLLEENSCNNVSLINESFENVSKYVNELDVVMYNLGYLPKGDKSIVTTADVTVSSLNEVLSLLKKDGLISIMCYVGHEEGKKETLAVESFIKDLDNREYEVIKFDVINKLEPPILYIVIKK